MSKRYKYLLFTLVCGLLLVSCGQKSTIKNSVKAEKLSCVYGDCKYIDLNFTLPLDDSSLAFKTPIPAFGPIAGGIIKFVGDVFAKNTNMGKLQFSYTQPIPEIPSNLHSVRLKRFFFYMKPTDKKKQSYRGKVHDWFNRYILGKGHTTFAFINKFALRLATSTVEEPENYIPALLEKLENPNDLDALMKVFKDSYRERLIDTEVAEDIILLKYHKKSKEKDTSHRDYGKIHYLETTLKASDVKEFLLAQPELQGHFVRILLLGNSLLIELSKDPVSDEIFKDLMITKAEEMDALGVNYIDTCTDESCLEVNVPDVNVLPIATKGNALKFDSILHASDVPESFKLKGFVEFEVKIESDV